MAKKVTKINGDVTNITPKFSKLLKDKGFDWHTCNYRQFLAFLKRNAGCFTPLNQAAREVVSELRKSE